MANHQRHKAPFVIRVHGVYRDLMDLAPAIADTEKIEEIEGVLVRGVSPLATHAIKTRLVFFPKSFFREASGRSWRSDVSWLLSHITGVGTRLREVPDGGGRYIIWSTDAYYYDVDNPVMGSWAEYSLVLLWLRYITGLSVSAQRRGKERRHLKDIDDTREARDLVQRLLEG